MKRKRPSRDYETTPSKRSRVGVRDPKSTENSLNPINGLHTAPKRRTTSRAVPVAAPVLHVNEANGTLVDGKDTTKFGKKKIAFATQSNAQTEDESVHDAEGDDVDDGQGTAIVRNADRSARRKSSARFIERTLGATGGDDEESEEEDLLAREILDEDDHEELHDEFEDERPVPETPSKRPRGRPKGSKNKRSPTPPLASLPAHETYFWQNRPGGGKTSNNILPKHFHLNHDEYFKHRNSFVDPHAEEREFLLSLHKGSFRQWDFELKNGFNICLYGFGSKRDLIKSYAEHIHDSCNDPPKIVIVNGYHADSTLRDTLTTVATTLISEIFKLPLQPRLLLDLILSTLTETAPTQPTYILINCIDAPSFRRPIIQSTLATLAAHSNIRMVATADSPNFPLLWDTTLRQQLNFIFHDCTTFESYDSAEIDPVQSVNEVLGRSGRRVGGSDGVGYVLRSLPENARNLYRILIAEYLADYDGQVERRGDGEDDSGNEALEIAAAGEEASNSETGVEYRILWQKAREELVCSTEHQFRGLMKEFYDHQMVESRTDGGGTERFVVPLHREDLKGLLLDLAG